MNIFLDLKTSLTKIIQNLASQNKIEGLEKKLSSFVVEPSKDKSHGDVATNVAMVLCKSFDLKPKV